MKITDLAIIFVIITLPFSFMLDVKAKNINKLFYRKLEINRALDTAVEDGASFLVREGRGKNIVILKEKAVEGFLNSLYVSFNVMEDGTARKRLTGYIPAIIVIDYDGYHILSNEEYVNSSGNKEIKLVWKLKRKFTYLKDRYIYSFTLDDYVDIYDIDNKEFLQGKREDLRGKIATDIISDGDLFERVRRRTITESLKKDINFHINRHNTLARQFGISYNFTLPSIKEEDWYRTVDDVGMLVFFQGMPLGVMNERYNNFVLGGARVVKGIKYYAEKDSVTGISYYHREDCTLLTGKEIIYTSRKECAQEGLLPCHNCNP